MVSCGLRPQSLASWHVLPLCGGSLAPSWLHGGRNSAPPPSGFCLRQSKLGGGKGVGGPIITFAWIDRFCPGLSDSLTSHTRTDLETNSLVYFLGSFIDCQGKGKPEN